MDDCVLPGELILRILESASSASTVRSIELLCRKCFALVRSNDSAVFKPLVLSLYPNQNKTSPSTNPILLPYETWRDLLRLALTWPMAGDAFSYSTAVEAHTIMSTLLPPPPEGCAWDDRRILAIISTEGCTSTLLRLPIPTSSSDTALPDTITAVAHFMQDPPHSGTGDIISLAVSDLRPNLTRAIELDVTSYNPLSDSTVRSRDGRFPLRVWRGVEVRVEVLDRRMRRVAVVGGPAGMDALRGMRRPGEGVLCGDYYALVCGFTGTCQLWFVGDVEEGADARRVSRRRLRWIKGFVGADRFVDNLAMNEILVAARQGSGTIILWWLDGSIYGSITLPSLTGLEEPASVKIAMTRFHLLAITSGTPSRASTMTCCSLLTLKQVWSREILPPDGTEFDVKRLTLAEDETCVFASDGESVFCLCIDDREGVRWFTVPGEEREGFDPSDGFWVAYRDCDDVGKREGRSVSCIWRYV
ncbi:hypothetical protein HDU67_001298 [Dinochytrium kinnereticum]|nr:hypothetical protein HDU67_001298 [Dinochytrium kinnereticum]